LQSFKPSQGCLKCAVKDVIEKSMSEKLRSALDRQIEETVKHMTNASLYREELEITRKNCAELRRGYIEAQNTIQELQRQIMTMGIAVPM
jgi:predicted RNase H-like nuclease (RuvC/YqgF family)